MGYKAKVGASAALAAVVLLIILNINPTINDVTYFCEDNPNELFYATNGLSEEKAPTKLYIDPTKTEFEECKTGWVNVNTLIEEDIVETKPQTPQNVFRNITITQGEARPTVVKYTGTEREEYKPIIREDEICFEYTGGREPVKIDIVRERGSQTKEEVTKRGGTNEYCLTKSEYIKLGDNTIIIENQTTQSVLFSITNQSNVTATLYWDVYGDGTNFNNSVNDIFVNFSTSTWKFGAYHNNTEWEKYKYVIETENDIIKERNRYYIVAGEDRYRFDASDICTKKIKNESLSGIFGVDDTLYFANCSYNLYNNGSTNVLEILFGSDSFIDPTFVLDNTAANSVLTNITSEEGNFTHLSLSTDSPFDTILLYIPFNNNYSGKVYDYSGNDIDFSIVSDSNITQSCGFLGGCYRGDGTDGYLNAGSITPYPEIEMNDNVTILMWVYANILVNNAALFSISNAYGYNNPFVFAQQSDGDLQYVRGSTLNDNRLVSTIDYNASEWTMIGVAANNSNTTFYVNLQTEVFPNISNGNPYSSAKEITIGSWTGASGEYDGDIGLLMIFNKTLNHTEITNIYNNQSAIFRGSGTQVFNGTNVSSTGSENRLNVTVNDYTSYFGSNISVSVNGSFYALNSSGQVNDLQFTQDPENLNITFRYLSGEYAFYSPTIGRNVTFDSYVGDTGGSNATVNLTDGLVFRVPHDNNDSVNDVITGCVGTNDGAIYDANGKINGSYNYTEDKVGFNSTDCPQLDIGNESFTLSFWLNPINLSVANFFIGKKGAGADTGFFGYSYTDGSVQFGARGTGTGCYLTTAAGVFVAGEYQLITIKRNVSSNNFTVYKNTTLVGTVNNVQCGDNITSAEDFFIGAASGVAGNINMKFDEVCLWNRAINDAEITELYNGSTGQICGPVIVSGPVTDTYYPQFSNEVFNVTNNSFYDSGNTIAVNITVSNTNGTVTLDWNGTDYAATNTTGKWQVDLGALAAGTYTYNWSAVGNGTDNNLNGTDPTSYVVQKNADVCDVVINTSTSITYPSTVQVASNCTSAFYIEVNGTQYANQSNILLGVSTWNITVYRNDTQNYTNTQDTISLTVGQATGVVSLSFNDTTPIVYPSLVTPSCTVDAGEVQPTLTRNGTSISNNASQFLGASNWTFVCQIAASQNYTTDSDSGNFQITQASQVLTLSLLPSNSESNGTETNVSGSGNQTNATLYRDGTPVSNPEVATLAIGVYNYTFNTTGNQNYSSYQVSASLTIINTTSAGVRKFEIANSTSISAQIWETGSIVGMGYLGIGTLLPTDTVTIIDIIRDASVYISAGETGFDPKVIFNEGTWSIGVDASNDNIFKIGNSHTVGANVRMQIDSDGNVTFNTGTVTGGRNIYSGYANLKSANFTSTPVEINFDVDKRKDSFYTHSTSSNPQNITVTKSGDYFVSFETTINSTIGTAVTVARCYLEVGDVLENGTACYTISRGVGTGSSTCSSKTLLTLTASDVIDVECVRHRGNNTLSTVPRASRLNIEWVE